MIGSSYGQVYYQLILSQFTHYLQSLKVNTLVDTEKSAMISELSKGLLSDRSSNVSRILLDYSALYRKRDDAFSRQRQIEQ